MKKFKISIICLVILQFVITAVSFAFLGDIIPMHFGINGQPDQFGSKYFMLIFPIVSLIIGGSMLLVVRFCKVSDNYKKYTLLTGVILEAMFTVLAILFIVIALTYTEETMMFDISKIMLPLCGVLFIILGNFMPKIEKNRTLGIKSKWSQYNDVTWQKTHRFAGFGGVLVGTLCLILGLFFKEMVNFIILMVLLIGFCVSSTIASYVFYKQEKAKEVTE